ncbi:MAG: hypothetical protein QOD42_3407 [Sphingomonadales bacterium]|nr:hypothetical protein [Sphingomonadales bacterium]
MAKIRLPPIGFWSYVRRDDERNRGKISELRELVLAELETQIGGDVPVFKDTISIPHGVRWEALTTQALSDATFFIPILTPNFLQSEWCCKEVRLFLEREQELFAAYPDLPKRSRIFPIHYVDVEEDADTTDETVRDTLMQLQHFSFQRRRNLRYDEPEVRDFVSAFVTDIRNLLKARVEQPEAPAPAAIAVPNVAKAAPKQPRPSSPAPSPPPPPPPAAIVPPPVPLGSDADARPDMFQIDKRHIRIAAAILGVVVLAVLLIVVTAPRYVPINNAALFDPCAVDANGSDCLSLTANGAVDSEPMPEDNMGMMTSYNGPAAYNATMDEPGNVTESTAYDPCGGNAAAPNSNCQ